MVINILLSMSLAGAHCIGGAPSSFTTRSSQIPSSTPSDGVGPEDGKIRLLKIGGIFVKILGNLCLVWLFGCLFVSVAVSSAVFLWQCDPLPFFISESSVAVFNPVLDSRHCKAKQSKGLLKFF